MKAAPLLTEAIDRPSNGFAVLRLVLALAVVVSHGFSVTSGRGEDEPLVALTGFSLGEHAVNGFFAISGFLVTMSFVRRGAWDYAVSRTLRIAPGFVVSALVVSLALGAALTRLPLAEYFADPGLWRYLRGLLTTFKTNAVLPGVFPDNPLRYPMGTVWTLKWEVICYAGVFLSGIAGLLRGRWPALAATVALLVALVLLEWAAPGADKGRETMLRLPFLFTAGGTLFLWRDRLRLSGWPLLALALATVLLGGTVAFKALLFAAEAYGAIWLAYHPALARPVFDLRQDLSYGTYLYGWPIQQALVQLVPGGGVWLLLAGSLALTLPVAALSWLFVEKPCLALKARTLGRRTLRTIEPASP